MRWTFWILPLEVAALLWPVGMVSVLDGTIDDGYGGILGWFWIACVVTTAGLLIVTRAALKERAYSAVMAATGLLYLAILTAFGTDLVARAGKVTRREREQTPFLLAAGQLLEQLPLLVVERGERLGHRGAPGGTFLVGREHRT